MTGQAASDAGLADGTLVGGRFVVRRKLGGGGMGEVFLAENVEVPDKRYAIKVLRPEFSADPRFVSMLRDEATKQARLEHDNVVGMIDFFAWEGRYCLLQDFVAGKTLAQLIAEQPGGLAPAVALPLMRGILSGLDHAHALGILHCDVKPANVIVDSGGRPRLTDFGISRDVGVLAGDSSVVGAGTLEYMSPEQVLTPRDIDHRSDVYSAGVVFFEMLCGRLPFELAPDAGRDALPQLQHDAPDLRSVRADVPAPLARIVATALQRDPNQRFQGCADVEQAIAEHQRRERWKRTWLPGLVVAALVALVVAGGLYKMRSDEREAARAAERRNAEVARANAVRTRATAVDAVRNAATALGLLCREWIDYGIKAQGVAAARDAGLADLVPKFRQRLAEMEANMDQHAREYGAALSQLRSVDAAVLASALTDPELAQPAVRRFLDAIRADDAAQRGATPPAAKTRQALVERCPAPVR